jgi:hypothetical protein
LHNKLQQQPILSPLPWYTIKVNKSLSFKNIQQMALPISYGFLSLVLQKNPEKQAWYHYTASLSLLAYYVYALVQNYQKNKEECELIALIQELFRILIITHGIHNKLCQHYKSSYAVIVSPTNIYNFLENLSQDWSLLCQNYQKITHTQTLYVYPVNHINTFEVLQAGVHYEEIWPDIIHFYHTQTNFVYYDKIMHGLNKRFLQTHEKIINLNQLKM